MFMDMLILADADGVVDMTYDAIARRLNMIPERVVLLISELMEPDPASRSPKLNGQRLALLDSHREWGWRIVNFQHYRELRDEEGRKAYFRDYMRERRGRQRVEKSTSPSQSVASGQKSARVSNGKIGDVGVTGARPTNANGSDHASRKHLLTPVNTCKHPLTHAEEEEDVEEVPSAVYPPGRQPANDGLIVDPEQAKSLICEKILGGKDPRRPWSYDAQERLEKLTRPPGLPLYEIERIAWFRSLPKTDEIPELRNRRDPVTETGLMGYWGDEFVRAEAYWQKKHSGTTGPKKEEPPQWREFFRWLYDGDIRLPDNFWDLDERRQAEYDRQFYNFSEATAAKSAAN